MNLWKRQILAIIRIDLAKTFFAKRGLWIYFLAFAPAIPMMLHGIFLPADRVREGFSQDPLAFAGIFQFFYLRIAIFFGCVGIFMNLFRGEMLDKSLHYYLLAPMRREVLVVGKFLSGLIAAVTIFGAGVIVQWIAMDVNHPRDLIYAYMFSGPGFSHLLSYLLAATLACIGYGSVFLWAGVRYRNPLIPAAIILVWEAINPFLPSILKKVSIIYWLKSLCPVSLPITGNDKSNFLTLLVTDISPAPVSVAAINLLVLAGFVLAWAAMRARRVEIGYGTE